MSNDGPTGYESWLDRNMNAPAPQEVLELYESVQEGEATGDEFDIRWKEDFMFVSRAGSDDEAKIYPTETSSSKDAFLYGMELRWGDNNGEQGLRDWVEEQLSD